MMIASIIILVVTVIAGFVGLHMVKKKQKQVSHDKVEMELAQDADMQRFFINMEDYIKAVMIIISTLCVVSIIVEIIGIDNGLF